jgi:hypothetical protein
MSSADNFCNEVHRLTSEIQTILQQQQQQRRTEQRTCVTALQSVRESLRHGPPQSQVTTEGFRLPRVRF